MNRRELLLYTLQNQYLLQKADRNTVVSGLCGLQAQFANNPSYALRIRASDFSEDNWDKGLVKVWTHRNTIHVILQEELGLYLSAKGVQREWTESWWGIPVKVKPYWSAFIREKVAEGICGREGLKEACRLAGMEEDLLGCVFNGWGGLIKEMSYRGLIAYEPGTQKHFLLPKEPVWMDRDEARCILMERYFTHYGPATAEDCAAFTGWRLTEVRSLLRRADLPLQSVECEGTAYYYIGSLRAERGLPSCVYLAGFDQLLMGYKDRSRFMEPEDGPLAVNQAGIVFPGILLYGRLRARWKWEGGRLLITPYRPLSEHDCRLIAAAGRRLFASRKMEVLFQKPCRG